MPPAALSKHPAPFALAWHVALLLALAPTCQAQTIPEAGSLLQRIERERGPQATLPAVPRPAPALPAMASRDALSVTVTAFIFTGNKLLNNAQLAAATASFLNRPLNFSQLQQAAVAAAQAYRQEGWIVTVYLPQQEIDSGAVRLQVIEALFGSAVIEGAASRRITTEQVVGRLGAVQAAGQPVRGDAVDRALLLLDDLPGSSVAGSLRPGQREGETDLVLAVTDQPLVSGEMAIDNTGSDATGSRRLVLSANLNSPLARGDLWSAQALVTDGVNYLRLAQSLPVGYSGWRVGGSASALRYRVISPAFAALDVHGNSQTLGLETNYPLVRSRLRNLVLAANIDYKQFDNQSAGATTTRYRIGVATVGLFGNMSDNFNGGGTTEASLAASTGKLDLNSSPNQAADAATTRAAGWFTRLRYSVARQQVLTPDVSASLLFSGQAAGKNLDPAEKFYLGGIGGVRAYPTSEAGGATGQMLNAELRARLPHGFTAAAFYDAGRVTVNVRGFVNAPVPNNYSLRGAGLSLAWLGSTGTQLKATWARRLGSNPNPTASGADQDGTLRRDRVWLAMSQPF